MENDTETRPLRKKAKAPWWAVLLGCVAISLAVGIPAGFVFLDAPVGHSILIAIPFWTLTGIAFGLIALAIDVFFALLRRLDAKRTPITLRQFWVKTAFILAAVWLASVLACYLIYGDVQLGIVLIAGLLATVLWFLDGYFDWRRGLLVRG